MAGDLILNSLEIQRFRCFRELRIERLGRVNLIVGKNNVGKSTVLDALRLFAKPGSLADLLEILSVRDEVLAAELDAWGRGITASLPVDSLFFGRKAVARDEQAIKIGPIASPDETLRVALQVSIPAPAPAIHSVGSTQKLGDTFVLQIQYSVQSLVFQVGSAARLISAGIRPWEKLGSGPNSRYESTPAADPLIAPIRDIPLYAVGPDGLDSGTVTRLWDDVSLSSVEADVIDALRIISPEVERVAVRGPGDRIGRNLQGQVRDDRTPFVKIQNFEEPMPLRALGDGVSRLFGLALALVNAKGGLLLVDEIENGIHYTVQADLWRLVFETAARLNVQVFATTHSYDCIKAFEEAARESEEEGVLIRLARKGDRTLVGEFDERELEIAVEGEIEVR